MSVDDVTVYRMSKSGECVRALVADQYEHPEVRSPQMGGLLERTAQEGVLHEEWVKSKLRSEGLDIIGEQEEMVIQVLPRVVMVGHIDGLVVEPGVDNQLLEIKSMSTKQFDLWAKNGFSQFPRYAAQITSYMKAFDFAYDVRYVVKRRDDGLISTTIIPRDQPPADWNAIQAKIITAERYRRTGDYPPCDLSRDKQWMCSFKYLHDEEMETPAGATQEEQMAMAELVLWFRQLKDVEVAGEEAGKERKGKVSPSILNLLGERDKIIVEVEGKKYLIERRRASGSRVDTTELRALHPEIAATVERPYESFYPVVREVT